MNVHVIDVGQGAATLFEFPCGAVLIDTGGEDGFEAALNTYLDEFFARRADLGNRLDLLVVTHPHVDHNRGVCDVISRYGPKNLLDSGLPGIKSAEPGQQCLHDAADDGVPYAPIQLSDVVSNTGIKSSVIDPVSCSPVDPDIRVLFGQVPREEPLLTGWSAKEARNANNNSVVTRIDFGGFSMIVTGDLEERGIEELIGRTDPAVLDVDVYQVGHHASRNATTVELLEVMTPEVAVIGMGDSAGSRGEFSAWAFAHPSDEAMTLLVHPSHGVSRSRDPVTKPVGLRGKNPDNGTPPEWTTWTIDRGVYGTGWDGAIVLAAKDDGSFTVATAK